MTWDYRIVVFEHGYGRDMPDLKAYHYHIMEVTYEYDENNNVRIDSMVERDVFIDSTIEALWEDLQIMIGAFKKPVLDKDGKVVAPPLIKEEDVLIADGSDMARRIKEVALAPIREWYKSAPKSIVKLMFGERSE